jgi:hypothetical protein
MSATAYAADTDVVLLPDARSSDGTATDVTGPLGEAIRDVLGAAKFFVPNGADVARVTGIDLDGCATDQLATCTSEALVSLPVRLALVLDVRRETDGAIVVDADFFHEGTLEPTFEETMRVGDAADVADLALQVAQFARSASKVIGATPPEQRQAARRILAPVEPVRAADAFALLRPAGPPSPPATLEAEPPDVAAVPLAPTSIAAEADEALDDADVEEDAEAEVVENTETVRPTPQRWLAGVRERHKARTTSSAAWYAAARPHGGRAIVEVRLGATTSDVNRSATSLGALDAEGEATQLYWVEGPRKGVAPGAELAVGYAPSAWFDATLVVGVEVARDVVGVGVMQDGEEAPSVNTVPTTVPRARLGGRLRVWPAPTGLAKPFLEVGADAAFVADWRFTTPGAEAFARPPGGVVPWVIGGGGVALDPTSRVGVLLGVTAAIPLGPLTLTRTAGELVGPPPQLPIAAGWALRPSLGVQLRF